VDRGYEEVHPLERIGPAGDEAAGLKLESRGPLPIKPIQSGRFWCGRGDLNP